MMIMSKFRFVFTDQSNSTCKSCIAQHIIRQAAAKSVENLDLRLTEKWVNKQRSRSSSRNASDRKKSSI